MSVLSDSFGGHTLDNKVRCTPDESRKMEAYVKRRHAVMAAELSDAEDDKLLSAKLKER